jgi:Nif-specific ferredoxin III
MMEGKYLTRDGTEWTPSYLESIEWEKCLGCGRCFKVCGQGVIGSQWVIEEGEPCDEDDGDAERMVMKVVAAGLCVGCRACQRVCSTNAQVHVTA